MAKVADGGYFAGVTWQKWECAVSSLEMVTQLYAEESVRRFRTPSFFQVFTKQSKTRKRGCHGQGPRIGSPELKLTVVGGKHVSGGATVG